MDQVADEIVMGREPAEVETRLRVAFRGEVTLGEDAAPLETSGRDVVAEAVRQAIDPDGALDVSVSVETLTPMRRSGGPGTRELDTWQFEPCDADGVPIGSRSFVVEEVGGPLPFALVLRERGTADRTVGNLASRALALGLGTLWREGRVDETLGVG